MKLTLSLILVFNLAIFYTTLAQTSSEKPDSVVLKKVAGELCGCFKDLKIADDVDVMSSPQTKDCMGFILFKYRKELKTSYANLSESDYTPEIGEKISRKQGIRAFPYLLRGCPLFFDLLIQQAEKDLERYEQYEKELANVDTTQYEEPRTDFLDSTSANPYQVDPAENEIEVSDYSAKGKLKKIETKGYTYLIITDEQGKDQSFLWLYSFEGADKIQNEFKKYKGKSIKVYWYENSVYDAKRKQYITGKQISWIEFFE
jgi:hypothetical protein